ncbi:MAG: hypothetical protein IPK19_26205 [Chloroflexi bacterium]|nr:hypothetical protein [Chloroflexota bacterium]
MLIYAASQRALHPDWRGRLARGFPRLAVIATGMAWCNARSALLGIVKSGGIPAHAQFSSAAGRRPSPRRCSASSCCCACIRLSACGWRCDGRRG